MKTPGPTVCDAKSSHWVYPATLKIDISEKRKRKGIEEKVPPRPLPCFVLVLVLVLVSPEDGRLVLLSLSLSLSLARALIHSLVRSFIHGRAERNEIPPPVLRFRFTFHHRPR